MNTPKLTPSNGFKPAENKSYTLSYTIFPSNPNPVTKNEWFQNDKKIVNENLTQLKMKILAAGSAGKLLIKTA